jgi:O-antigen/teichoic acid export membrane protein
MFLQNKISLKGNILSNFVGQGWSFLVGMIAVPFYIRFLGVEGYGLVGFYGALRAIFNSFLDFGLTVTIKREIARYTASPTKIGQTRDLVRTLEIAYWLIGLILGLIVCLGAPWISNYWINSETIPASTIENVIVIMGVITFVQWPLTLYQGGLIGLQKIVLLNGINVSVATLRGVGGILAVWLFPQPIIAFFIWQVILSLFQLGLTTYLLWRSLPPIPNHEAPRFRKSIIVEIWRFALGMGGSSFFGFFLGQADKVILSKILTLEHFGYYSIAVALNEQLQLVNTQIAQPLFPRFSALVSQNDRESLRDLYHKACQLVSVIILPVAGTAAFFSRELIHLWIQDGQIATIVAPIATLLFVGTLFGNFIDVPFSITIAYGWVRFVFYRSLILSLLVVPLMIVLSLRYAGIGAALTWALLNLAQLIVLPLIIHQKILKGELKRWYIFDVGIPVVVSLTVLGTVRWLMTDSYSSAQTIAMILAAALITFGFAVLGARDIRSSVVANFMAYFKKLQSS